ncbi:nucleotide exchange factor GrpE [Ferrimicrobium sp.]|uniref:nucleotide exchange factor GrpE n=1 Tax=Ferrimicrobium sp. TaxID=2926050 RepID=UPI002615F74E|nr:nucleotide exchange factor GrpE [Ferrimicrobium sp.]
MADERFDEEHQDTHEPHHVTEPRRATEPRRPTEHGVNEDDRAKEETPFDGGASSSTSGEEPLSATSNPGIDTSDEQVNQRDATEPSDEAAKTQTSEDASIRGDEVEGEFDLDALDFEPEEINDPLADAERERDSYLEALQRLQADFENYKKRVARQQSELGAAGSRSLVTKLLPALDTLTLALAHATSESGSDEVASVLSQISAAFLEVLAKEGLEVIEPLGKRFNPEEAEAVAHDAGDGEPTVSEVFRVGYRWNGQTLRPAMVKVTGS